MPKFARAGSSLGRPKAAYRSGSRKKIFSGDLEVASLFERSVIDDLRALKVPFSYEPDSLEIKLPLRGGHCTKCGASKNDLYKAGVYTVDIRLDGPVTAYVECKGRLTSFERTRLKALYAAWGDKFPLYLLLQRNNKLGGKSKTTYREWAEAVGFTVAVGAKLPHEWLINSGITVPVSAGDVTHELR